MLIFNKGDFKKQMRLLGLTQEDMLEIIYAQYGIELSRGTFSKVINGSVHWKLELAMAVSEILDVEVNELFKLKK